MQARRREKEGSLDQLSHRFAQLLKWKERAALLEEELKEVKQTQDYACAQRQRFLEDYIASSSNDPDVLFLRTIPSKGIHSFEDRLRLNPLLATSIGDRRYDDRYEITIAPQWRARAELWFRFPKFVLGYMIASVVFSFLLSPSTVAATKGMLGSLRTWWFALAFTSIGLETRFKELAGLGGGRPALPVLIGQTFNIFWTLLLAYLIFGGYLFPAPKL